MLSSAIRSKRVTTLTNTGENTYLDRLVVNIYQHIDDSYMWMDRKRTPYLHLEPGDSYTFNFTVEGFEPGLTYNIDGYYYTVMGESKARYFIDKDFDIPDHVDAIDDILARQTDDVWYTLSGIRLQGKPTTRGLYIHGNRKLWVK